MPNISKKGIDMPESPIRKLAPFADKAKASGKHIYQLNIGQPDIKTPENALNAVKNNQLDILAYSPSQGFESYREKLARYYKKHDIAVNADQLLITTGGSEALMFVMGSITDAGDEVIIAEPFYANYNGFATAMNVNVKAVTAKLSENFALPPISDFEAEITNKTKAIILCNPGNPTGYIYTREEMQAIADLAVKHDLFVVADEVYREFAYEGHLHHSILTFPELKEHAIMVDSVSKRFSMCGARIGCLVTKNDQVIKAAMKFAQARLSPPTFAQIAAEEALSVENVYFDEVISEYRSRRDTLIEELRKIDGITIAKPKGAFYCTVELPIDDAEDLAKWLLESFDIDGETLMVAPAAGFYATSGLGKSEVRLAYVLEKESLKKAVHILKEGLKAYQNR
jgi:aspartate aminotransferase